MAFQSISANEVRLVIEKADKALNNCFDMLVDFRYGRDNASDAVYNFQPQLAECLSALMEFYQKLHREKDELIKLKTSLNSMEFTELISTNAKYSQAVKTVIEIGKNLGDAYAWFFYKDNRDELERQFEHDPTGLYVSGIGGKGELEFIKRNKNFDGFYVLYHGITTMLRVGDFSLFDPSHGIIGVGELKTREIDNGLQVSGTITSKTKINVPNSTINQKKSIAEQIVDLKKEYPRIEKQLQEQEKLLDILTPDKSLTQYSSYDYDILAGLTPQTPVVSNSDKSLLLVAVWSQDTSLFDVLIESEMVDSLPESFALDAVGEQAKSLIDPTIPHNMFFLGPMDTRVNILSIPIMWWKIDESLCRDIYFHRVHVMTIFNPAKLLNYYIQDGFTVSTADRLDKFVVNKTVSIDGNNVDVSLGHFNSICYLISNSLMKTKDVFEGTRLICQEILNRGYQEATKVDIRFRLCNFGKPNGSEDKKKPDILKSDIQLS